MAIFNCAYCGKEFKAKPSAKRQYCSKECANKLKETTYLGENNHQFGLKGYLNSSFKGLKTKKYNNHLEDVWVYRPDHPESNKDGRITEHRLNVLDNYTKFDPCFFIKVDNYIIFNPDKTLKICVHHINGNHSDNNINNLIPLTNASHRKVHSDSLVLAEKKLREIIGVVKQGELLETPEVDNQQPSTPLTKCEGSETNS